MSEDATFDLRMQTAMVLFSLEQALAEYVKQRACTPGDAPKVIIERATEQAALSEDRRASLSVAGLIESTYLSELFDWSSSLEGAASGQVHIRRLKDLAELLELFQIRNAVAHPARPFPRWYWHRMAAIAADPAIASLQLTQVSAALDSALAGRITSPPEGWFSELSWKLPNNLPPVFEHTITGLLGRTQEVRTLMTLLANRRNPLIAITGPGGSGKTAVALAVLDEACRAPATSEWTEQIVFVSAKAEALTAEGVRTIADAALTMSELSKDIAEAVVELLELECEETFDAVCETAGAVRTLICIDNLDTVLRDAPGEFDAFNQTLPEQWRLLVTSRVTVNGANTVPLPTMSHTSAETLFKRYLLNRGGTLPNDDVISRVALACDSNPLALRLTVDAYLNGRPLEEALSSARTNVLEFSLRRLVETLSKQALRVMEALYLSVNSLERSEVATILEVPLDEVGEAMNLLVRTSLLDRQTTESGERYSLPGSVRDLLVLYPPDDETRREVANLMRRHRETLATTGSQATRSGRPDVLRRDYVDPTLPVNVQRIAISAFRASGSSEKQQARLSLEVLTNAITGEHAVLCRATACVRMRLKDYVGAIRDLERVVQKHREAEDPASILLLAYLYRMNQQLSESRALSTVLIDAGWDDPAKSSVQSASEVLTNYWVSRIWLGETREAVERLSDWESGGELSVARGVLYATAMRRDLERLGSENRDAACRAVVDLIACYDKLIPLSGHSGQVVHEGLNFVDNFASYCATLRPEPALALKMATFLDTHVRALCNLHRTRKVMSPEIQMVIRAVRGLDVGGAGNPLESPAWTVASEGGSVSVAATHFPIDTQGSRRSYFFAQDARGVDYYIRNVDCEMSDAEVQSLVIGDVLEVVPSQAPFDAERARPVTKALRIGQVSQPPGAASGIPTEAAPCSIEIQCTECAARGAVHLGQHPGDSALYLCVACGSRQHFHRMRTGSVLCRPISKGPEGRSAIDLCDTVMKHCGYRDLRDPGWRVGVNALSTLTRDAFPSWEDLRSAWSDALVRQGEGNVALRINRLRQLAMRGRLFEWSPDEGVRVTSEVPPLEFAARVEQRAIQVYLAKRPEHLPAEAIVDLLAETEPTRRETIRQLYDAVARGVGDEPQSK